MSDDLVERVMMEMIASVGMEDLTPDDNHALNVMSRAAIAVLRPALRAEVLEEAAKVADGWVGCSEWSADTNSGYECASREIAAAIRKLKADT